MNNSPLIKAVGVTVLAFGCGILLSFFLPTCILAVIEALIIIAAGLLLLIQKH